MKKVAYLMVGILLGFTCLADPSLPSETNLLSTINNLDIKADEWSITNGVLSKASLYYLGDKLLIVKGSVVKVPIWYGLSCSITNVQKRSGVLPEAGLVFGYVDSKNYWSVTIGGNPSKPILKLIHVAGGIVSTETSVPFVMNDVQEEVQLHIQVHHQLWVKVDINKSIVLDHRVSEGIAQGRVGLALTSGACGFSRLTIAGIAKH